MLAKCTQLRNNIHTDVITFADVAIHGVSEP